MAITLAGRLLLASVLVAAPGLGQGSGAREDLRAQVDRFLTSFHEAAAAANARAYLQCFREDAVIFGTAPGERYELDRYRARVTQAFSRGRGIRAELLERHVDVSAGGRTAWFDELVRREAGLELRATGVLRLGEDGWRIVLLDKVLPVPNEHAVRLAEKIRERLPRPSRSIPEGSPAAAALVGYHAAGREGDLERLLGFLAEDAILLGTAAEERHTPLQLRGMLEPHFARGRSLDSEIRVLHLTESEDGRFCWFDARLDKSSLCELRGSGLLRRKEDDWKIVRYNLAFPVPNDLIELTVGGSPFTRPVAVAALREDFAKLRSTLEEWHPALYVYEEKEAIDRLFDGTMGRIDEPLTPLQFEMLITPVVARVHCVHTRVQPTLAHAMARRRTSRYLPVEPQVIQDRLFVRRNYLMDDPELMLALAPGTEILEIDGRKAKEVIDRLLAVVSTDGWIRSHRIAELNDGFELLYATHLGSPEQFDLLVRAAGSGEERKLALPALDHEGWQLGVQGSGPVPARGAERELELEILPGENLAILTHRSFRPARSLEAARSIEEFFERLEIDGIGNLIVDLRDNPGGDPFHGALLVSYLVDDPFTYFRFDPEKNSALDALALRAYTAPRPPAEFRFRGEIYVLIGGRNTSTAGHVIALLSRESRAVLIGQESGATWTCNDNSADLLLPATGIQVHIAQTTYQAAVTGLPPGVGIRPDLLVEPTVEAMVSGRDLEMELARKLIQEGD